MEDKSSDVDGSDAFLTKMGEESKPSQTSKVTNTKQHEKCLKMAEEIFVKEPYVKFMLDALKAKGCEFKLKEDIVCEPCSGKILGGFDPETREVVLCENTIWGKGCMTDVLTHELIHAFDFCRAKYDIKSLKHLACTEVRAANLSGDCFFWKENFARFRFGWKMQQQKCVKHRAINSMLCVRDITKEQATEAVDSVFDACFKDTEPFERIPP